MRRERRDAQTISFPRSCRHSNLHSRRRSGRGPRTRSIPVFARGIQIFFFQKLKENARLGIGSPSPWDVYFFSSLLQGHTSITPKEAHCSRAVSPSPPSCTPSTRPAGRPPYLVRSGARRTGADTSGRGTRKRLASDISTWFKFPSTTIVAFFRWRFFFPTARDILSHTNLGTKTSEPGLKSPYACDDK